jgi:hypothetical protein
MNCRLRSYLSWRWERLSLWVGRPIAADHRRGKAVSLPDNCLHEPRLLRVVAEHLPHLANGGVNAVVDIEEDVVAPEARGDLVAGD